MMMRNMRGHWPDFVSTSRPKSISSSTTLLMKGNSGRLPKKVWNYTSVFWSKTVLLRKSGNPGARISMRLVASWPIKTRWRFKYNSASLEAIFVFMIEVLSEKLKDETKTSHQELEKLLVQKIKRIRVAEDYLTLLGYFYSFYAPLEKEIVSQLKDSRSEERRVGKECRSRWAEYAG